MMAYESDYMWFLLVRIHFIIVMIRWTGLTPWEFEFPFPQMNMMAYESDYMWFFELYGNTLFGWPTTLLILAIICTLVPPKHTYTHTHKKKTVCVCVCVFGWPTTLLILPSSAPW